MALFKTIGNEYFVSEGDLLNKKELAKALDVSISTIQRWQRIGMPFVHYSNNINGYAIAEVYDWIVKNNIGLYLKRRKNND